MKKIILILSAAIFFASCKKDSSVVPGENQGATKKIMSATYVFESDPPETETYGYDAQGRISVITEDDRVSTFDYNSAATVLVTDRKQSDNSLLGTKECTLNDKGFITKILFKNSAGAQTYSYNYTYNAEGYIIRQEGIGTVGSSGFETEYTIVNGNVVSSKTSHDGVLSNTSEYIVDETKPNKCKFSHAGYWFSSGLFGKSTKNLLKEYKSFDMSGALYWNSKSNYELDADGYPVKVTTVYPLEGTKGVDTYVFQ